MTVRWVGALAALVLVSGGGVGAARAEGELFTVNLGLKIGPNANMLSEPSEEWIDLPVPGFFGISWGLGLAAEALVRDLVGLELDLLFAWTSGTGDITFYRVVEVEQELSSQEIQIALLAKVQSPHSMVRPFLSLGPTFVIQLDSEYSIDKTYLANPPDTAIETESYVMLTVGLGVTLSFASFQIPLEVRGSYHPLDDDPTERVDWRPEMGGELTHLGVRSNWEGQVWILTGFQYSLSL